MYQFMYNLLKNKFYIKCLYFLSIITKHKLENNKLELPNTHRVDKNFIGTVPYN